MFLLTCLFFTLQLYDVWLNGVLISAGASQRYHHSNLKNGDRNVLGISKEYMALCVFINIFCFPEPW